VVLRRMVPGTEVNELKEIETMLAERVVSWTETWKREGLEQGIHQGMQQGMQQDMQQGVRRGESMLLARQLRRRFGLLGPEIHARLEGATAEQLEAWGENILDAATLEEVFSGRSPQD
jgi:flagellar biosynthesis/type III secretory pathway protein FliH